MQNHVFTSYLHFKWDNFYVNPAPAYILFRLGNCVKSIKVIQSRPLHPQILLP